MPYFESAEIQVSADDMRPIIPLIQSRMTTLDEGPVLTAFLFKDDIQITADELPGKNMSFVDSAQALEKSLSLLDALDQFSAEEMDTPMRALAEELGLKAGQLFTVIRNAVTGQKISPPLFESMELLGKEKVFSRMRGAVIKLLKV